MLYRYEPPTELPARRLLKNSWRVSASGRKRLLHTKYQLAGIAPQTRTPPEWRGPVHAANRVLALEATKQEASRVP